MREWLRALALPSSRVWRQLAQAEIIMSAPVSSIMGRYLDQACSFIGSMTETTTARSGQSRLTWRISSRLVASGLSVISSMLLSPIMRCGP